MVTRREFVRFGAATLAVSPAVLMAADAAGGACRTEGERLRIGILSDIHLKVEADKKKFVHERRRAAAAVPEFPAGAKLAAKVREVEGKKGARVKGLELTFPSVTGLHGGVRAYDYLATVDIESGENTQKIEKRFFSPKCDRSPEADAEDVKVWFPLDGVAEWKSLHVSVRPREIFGGFGAPIAAAPLTGKGGIV